MKNDKKGKKEEMALVLRKDIYQSNPMIQARKDFDVIGMRIFFLGLRGVNPHFSENDKFFDEEFNRLFVPTSRLVELFGGNTKYLSELKKACAKLFDSIVELNYDDGGFKLMHMFDELEYKPKEGLYLQFSRKMRPYILDLFQSRGYTRINVEYLFKLSSPYAVRLLELLLQYQNIKHFKELMEIRRKFTVAELRFALNVPEGSYSNRIDNFKKFVINVGIREINAQTPYIVRYETIKEGRHVVAFEFIMDTYNVPKDNEDRSILNSGNDAIKALLSLGFTEKIARKIFEKCRDEADCFSRINRAQALLDRNKKPIKNELGFLRKAIEEDWQVGSKAGQEIKKDMEPIKNQKATKKLKAFSRVDSSDDSIMSIGQVLQSMAIKPALQSMATKSKREDLTASKPKQINIGGKKISYNLAKAFMNAIKNKHNLDLVKEHLKEYRTTVEDFAAVCSKQGL